MGTFSLPQVGDSNSNICRGSNYSDSGGKDPDFESPIEEAQYLSSAMHSSLLLVDDAGHYPHVEMPDTVGPKIIAFLKGFV